ncbi:hypothetical protein J7I98_26870 [Streptomyces sp. ISL-98]|uniref:hypothetical protein n=1 Tax=Streptomyces sp. ISL-98 TaxID=2819192 RepID=UPI001BEB5DAA|nr:hypothetical protein [Streptomyces sp. ISL-98]MBT2509437.1 hypothetical protein [Streptomyces sp. ISL-98]
MKVAFLGCGDSPERVTRGTAGLEIGHEYDVLELYGQADGANYLRVEVAVGELPAMFDARLFRVVASSMHPLWEARITESGTLKIGPASWMRTGFWEAVMDGEEWAVRAYSKARDEILKNR